MKLTKFINTSRYKRFHYRQMWIEEDVYASRVYSYNTFIGILDWRNNAFITWGYGTYSRTTSKQITMLCNEFKLTRYDVKKPDMLED